jgi:hypothetical protein
MPEPQATLPVLVVVLGQLIGQFSKEVRPELKAVTSEYGQIISVPHELRIVAPGWDLVVTGTRFSSVGFEDGKVEGVEVNPHLEYLSLKEAAKLVDQLETKFRSYGFQPRPDRNINGEQLRAKQADILKESSYNSEVYRSRRSNVMCSLVLTKSVLKDSPLGQIANAKSDLFMLKLTVRNIKTGDRF